MTFEEHLAKCKNEDGSFDLTKAEQALAKELAQDKSQVSQLAKKAAHQERQAWERRQQEDLQKQVTQPALSAELELEVRVQIGGSRVVPLGEMNLDRIRLRRDLRTRLHLGEIKSFENEMRFWFNTEDLLEPDETIEKAITRIRPT